MKTKSPIREVLLMTNTSFSKRQLCETNIQNSDNHLPPAERLEAACWNGLLNEMLPEIMHASSSNAKLFLWEVEMKKKLFESIHGRSSCIPAKRVFPRPLYFSLQAENELTGASFLVIRIFCRGDSPEKEGQPPQSSEP